MYLSNFDSKAQVNNIDFIRTLQEYQDSVKLKYDRERQEDIIDKNTFDLDRYLALFDELNFNENLTFDYVFIDNFLDGNPYLYVRDSGFNLNQYLIDSANSSNLDGAKRNQFMYRVLYSYLNDSINQARNYVTPKETENGYLQYLFFYELGENFALKWHACARERHIILTKADIETIIAEYRDNQWYTVQKESLMQLTKIDPTPVVIFNAENCTIVWYEINEHSNGVYRSTYIINRFPPYKIELIEKKILAEINAAFLY